MSAPYPSTHLSLLHAAAESGGEARLVALGCLIERYRPCLCRLLERRLGIPEYDAENLVHDFIIVKILEGDLIQKYFGSTRRRFRHYLACSLRHFAIDKHFRPKRPLQGAEHQAVDVPAAISIADVEKTLISESFQELLVAVFRRVRGHYVGMGESQHWEVFLRRFVEPALTDRAPASYAELARELGFGDTKRACNLATTVLREFRRTWRELLLQDCGNDETELQAVLLEFRNCLAEGGVVDVRRLVLNSGLGEKVDLVGDSGQTPKSSALIDLLEGGFARLTDIEKEMLWKSYLAAPIAQFCSQDSIAGAEGSVASGSSLDTAQTFADFITETLPGPAKLVRLKQGIGNMVKADSSHIPKEIAAVLRVYVIAAAKVRSGINLSRGSTSRVKLGVERALQYEWLDGDTRAIFNEYLEQE